VLLTEHNNDWHNAPVQAAKVAKQAMKKLSGAADVALNQSDPVRKLCPPKSSTCDSVKFESNVNSSTNKAFSCRYQRNGITAGISHSHTEKLIDCETESVC
jgi:hypothetical protein